jgi:hypothetical protein
MKLDGLTDPYNGTKVARRYHAFGHTFRWVKGDSYIAVQEGTCIDGRRAIVVRETLAGHPVREGHQPVVDVIPAPSSHWEETQEFLSLVKRWAYEKGLLKE